MARAIGRARRRIWCVAPNSRRNNKNYLNYLNLLSFHIVFIKSIVNPMNWAPPPPPPPPVFAIISFIRVDHPLEGLGLNFRSTDGEKKASQPDKAVISDEAEATLEMQEEISS